jgi:hypothetical protein
MLKVVYKSQMAYPHGRCMCTTACMNMSIALLSNRIDIGVTNEEYIQRWLESIMIVSDRMQAIIEANFDSGPMATNVRDYINIIGFKHAIPNARLLEYVINDELGKYKKRFIIFINVESYID